MHKQPLNSARWVYERKLDDTGGSLMKQMTEKNLRDAFAGESQAHMRYLIYARKAEEEGKPNIARLFRFTLTDIQHQPKHTILLPIYCVTLCAGFTSGLSLSMNIAPAKKR